MIEMVSHQQIVDTAQRLIDWNTGAPSLAFRTDLSLTLPSVWKDFHESCARDLDFNNQQTQSVLFFPTLGLEMIKLTASLANRKQIELPGFLYGVALPTTVTNVEPLAVAYPVSSMNYRRAATATTEVTPQIARENAIKLAQQTNLSSVLSKLTGTAQGSSLAEFHIHHTGLGETFWGKPSGTPGGTWGDYAQIETLLTLGSLKDRKQPWVWAVFTLVDDELQYTVTKSSKMMDGQIVHEKLPIIEEQ